jgi:hypothetical protein
VITREIEPEIVGQLIGTKVLKFQRKKNGSYQVETIDGQANSVFQVNGVIQEFSLN